MYSELTSDDFKDPKPYEVYRYGLLNAAELVIKNNLTLVIIMDIPNLFEIPVNCGLRKISIGKCYNKKQRVIDE